MDDYSQTKFVLEGKSVRECPYCHVLYSGSPLEHVKDCPKKPTWKEETH